MSRAGRARGFTLLEVVVALLVLEVGILAATATMVIAAHTLTVAETRARAANGLESVLDSLEGGASAGTFVRGTRDDTISGSVAGDGSVEMRYRSARVGVVERLQSVVPVVAGGSAP